jgi:hypothetical protein
MTGRTSPHLLREMITRAGSLPAERGEFSALGGWLSR